MQKDAYKALLTLVDYGYLSKVNCFADAGTKMLKIELLVDDLSSEQEIGLIKHNNAKVNQTVAHFLSSNQQQRKKSQKKVQKRNQLNKNHKRG